MPCSSTAQEKDKCETVPNCSLIFLHYSPIPGPVYRLALSNRKEKLYEYSSFPRIRGFQQSVQPCNGSRPLSYVPTIAEYGSAYAADHPDQLERLKADPSLLSTAIAKLLRFNGPVTMPAPRFATEDVEIAGQQLQKGDRVMVMLASTNRDPE